MSMKEKIIVGTISIIATVAIVIFLFNIRHIPDKERVVNEYVEYECDVKSLNLNTKIIINKEGKKIATVSGNIFRVVEDPLTLYDAYDNKIGYAGDTYHFISQDSHGIYVDNKFVCDMVGKVEFFGETYEIYDYNKNLIGKMEFNEVNTKGILYNANDELLAEYSSVYTFNDFNLKIYSNCTLDEKTVLMLFCSYYSDFSADNN